jgi:hypothetical protein
MTNTTPVPPDPPEPDDDPALLLEHLIAAPLVAAAKAATALAAVSADFVRTVGTDETGEARLVNFDFPRPVERPGPEGSVEVGSENVRVSLPLLAMVPVPSLKIDSVDTSFTMEVRSLRHRTSNAPDAVPQVIGKPTAQREHTRSTDKTAKYAVTVHASSDPPSEALARMLDLMAQSVAPMPHDPGNGSTSGSDNVAPSP